MSSVPVETPTFFYHSFPRIPNQQDHALGLKILDSILEKGLLLTAELRTFPALEGLAEDSFIQKRVCFTALAPERLPHHAETFGSFSLEFEGVVIRNFSALPAVYFSGRIPDGEMLNDSGDSLARHLLEAYKILGRLWDLQRKGVKEDAELANAVLNKIHPSKTPIEKPVFALQALLNLCYPTDDAKWTAPLHYYHQREWKIVPNFAYNDTWHFKPLTPEQRSDLLKINPKYFGADIKGTPRVDLCSTFYDVGKKNIVDSIRRIIVPDQVFDDARRILEIRGRKVELVPVSSFKGDQPSFS